ncbi:MAG TPA: SHOCT domain-containing protein [Gaiellaceae bacterium]|nr:SHOCT domain-containing protein [Gaiellaceae bacterium]
MFGRDKKLEDGGVHATAEVVSAEQSAAGVTAGNPALAGATEVLWKLDLKVKPDGADPFDAHVEATLPQYSALMVGSTVPVLLDPADHSKVTLDMSPQGWADASAAQVGALTGNAALAGPIKEMMEAAMKDPVGFRRHALEQAEQAFKSAGFNVTEIPGMVMPGMAAAGGSSESMVDTLQKLADLHDRGVLTDDEFAEQKAKLLGEK